MTASADQGEIAKLLQRYVDVTDAGTNLEWARLFDDEGEFRVLDRIYKGHERLARFISRAPKGVHSCSDADIQVDESGRRGRARSNFRFEAADGESHSRGVYTDDLVHTDHGWRIAIRRVEFAATGSGALAE